MNFDHEGKNLVVNSSDRIVRVYALEATVPGDEDVDTPPPKDEEPGYDQRSKSDSTGGDRDLVFQLLHKLQDPIQRSPWYTVGFSPDADYVLAGRFYNYGNVSRLDSLRPSLRISKPGLTWTVYLGSDEWRPGENS